MSTGVNDIRGELDKISKKKPYVKLILARYMWLYYEAS